VGPDDRRGKLATTASSVGEHDAIRDLPDLTRRATTMNAKELLHTYLASIQNPEAAAALFADDGIIELPTVNDRAQGPVAIQGFVTGLLAADAPSIGARQLYLRLQRTVRGAVGPCHADDELRVALGHLSVLKGVRDRQPLGAPGLTAYLRTFAARTFPC
jgi:hypothetical protein